MDKSHVIKLSSEAVMDISSAYIREGRSCEAWQINEIVIEGEKVTMDTSMVSVYSSESDKNDFHLSIFLAEEMTSQLLIIYMHIWAGLSKKRSEAWMVESHTKSIRSIIKKEHIKIEMDVEKIRKHGQTILALASYRITDDQGGLFKLQHKMMLS